jgi:manganese transport protein
LIRSGSPPAGCSALAIAIFPRLKRYLWNNKFLRYFGPAMIISVAYVDPGNFGTDIAAGSLYGYELLWVVWLASGMAMLLQYLSGKIGIATGKSMAELLREQLGSRRRAVAYWLASETFAIATDLAEFLGVAVALTLLFGIPLLYSAVIASFDVVLIFLIVGRRFRFIEVAISGLVAIIGFGYVYEIIITKPDTMAIVTNSTIPHLSLSSAVVAVGIVGATVMPHALALHSWLTRNKLKEGGAEEKRELLRYHLIDNVINLFVAGLVNAAILIMAAAAFGTIGAPVTSLQDAYNTLAPLFGTAAGVVFAVTLLASGLSSSMTGVLAGQALMEGLLGPGINPWLRRIVVRGINVVPTLTAIYLGFNVLDILVYSQVVLSLLIPLPLIPILYFTTRSRYMGEFVNKRATTLVALAFTGVILSFNGYLVVSTILG